MDIVVACQEPPLSLPYTVLQRPSAPTITPGRLVALRLSATCYVPMPGAAPAQPQTSPRLRPRPPSRYHKPLPPTDITSSLGRWCTTGTLSRGHRGTVLTTHSLQRDCATCHLCQQGSCRDCAYRQTTTSPRPVPQTPRRLNHHRRTPTATAGSSRA